MKESSVKNQKPNEDNTAFIVCGCQNEILVARYDNEYDMLDLCIYETKVSFCNKMKLWQKLRYVYQLFKTGQPYSDQMVLDREQIQKLKDFLENIPSV